MDNPRILQFQKAFRNFTLQPLLTTENIEKFRVEYDHDTPHRLTQALEDCDIQNNKLIFAGHRGCGKSTLLWEFSRNISDRYFSQSRIGSKLLISITLQSYLQLPC